jgi:hypothetical protein
MYEQHTALPAKSETGLAPAHKKKLAEEAVPPPAGMSACTQ